MAYTEQFNTIYVSSNFISTLGGSRCKCPGNRLGTRIQVTGNKGVIIIDLDITLHYINWHYHVYCIRVSRGDWRQA